MDQQISKDRSKNYIKQVKGSFIFKFLAIFSSFLLIPLIIKYLGMEQYGIWSTLLSIASWIILFDVGIANGLRNKISESLAEENKLKTKHYISTAYIILGIISLFLIIVFLIISEYISWQKVFNTISITNQELKYVVNITFVFLFLNFWISIINQVFNGFQKTSLVVFNQFLSNAFSLFAVFLLYKFYEPSLIKLSIIYGISLLSSSLILSIWFYKKNSEFIPKIIFFGVDYLKPILSLGFKFFILQIGVVVILISDKILITQLFGPEYVASYDVVFKLFSIITIAHAILLSPLWSSYSDAYHRNDMKWIKKTIKNQLKIYLLIIVATILLSLLIKPIVSIWIGKDFIINNTLIVLIAFFVLVSCWNNIFSYFINATNKLFVLTILVIFLSIINIPLSIFLVKVFHFGIEGIVLGTIISLLFGSFLAPIQTYFLIYKKETKSIWLR